MYASSCGLRVWFGTHVGETDQRGIVQVEKWYARGVGYGGSWLRNDIATEQRNAGDIKARVDFVADMNTIIGKGVAKQN